MPEETRFIRILTEIFYTTTSKHKLYVKKKKKNFKVFLVIKLIYLPTFFAIINHTAMITSVNDIWVPIFISLNQNPIKRIYLYVLLKIRHTSKRRILLRYY